MRLHMGEQLIVDALRGLAQGKLAQSRQIAGRKIVGPAPAAAVCGT